MAFTVRVEVLDVSHIGIDAWMLDSAHIIAVDFCAGKVSMKSRTFVKV